MLNSGRKQYSNQPPPPPPPCKLNGRSLRQSVKPTSTGTHSCLYQNPIKPKLGWLPIRISCRSGATCLPVN